MTVLPVLDDTIAAIATAPGEAGLAVVRVSGRSALAIADACFHARGSLAAAPTHTMQHGWAVWPKAPNAPNAPPAPPPDPLGAPSPRRLDEVVAAVFRAPRSYTREDVVELSCHGGTVPARRVLSALLAAGARLARPGEFTLRAYLHGRLDLAQAEAVADLIHAETEAASDLALAQLAGSLSDQVRAVADRVADCIAEVEARVDFAEDVGGVEVPPHVVAAIAGVRSELEAMLAGRQYTRAIREGLRVTLAGRPNAGKSSLFNALLGESRAIVSADPGTTRDRVSESFDLGGIRVELSDTAGLREPEDPVERIGVERTERAIADAGLVLWVVDASGPLALEDHNCAERAASRTIWVLNKCDLGLLAREELRGRVSEWVEVSAITGDGLELLRERILVRLGGGPGVSGAVGDPRHAEALSRAASALAAADRVAVEGAPGEIVALELREALAALGEVTGESIGEDLLDRIFSRFCIGK